MKLTNLKINDFFNEIDKFTFLVGAGCSIDSPSNLPAGFAMMEALIEHTCHQSEWKGIIELMKSGQLRFETLVEIIRDQLDPTLELIDFYGMCDKPNIQHFFLADMLIKGHFVMTTNFDHLIEYALNHSGIPLGDIVPIITREDFERYTDPYELLNQGKKLVYKVHGSPTNLITKQSTKDSLIATIQAFGSNKEAENVFQLESFKQPAFENITKERSLVVIGYSGSDDFDIVPTLAVLRQLKNVIWINYSNDIKMGNEQIYEINENTSQSLNKLDLNLKKVVQILLKIWQARNTEHVYLVNVNTSTLAEELIESKPKLSVEDFSLQPTAYLNRIYPDVEDALKFYIPYKIYIDKDLYDNALPCLKKLLRVAEDTDDKNWKILTLNNIGELYHSIGNYADALTNLENALELAKNLGSIFGINIKSTIFNNLATVYSSRRDYPAAINYYKDAARILRQNGNLHGTMVNLNNVGDIYRTQDRFPEALKYYEEALDIANQIGDINARGLILNNSGTMYVSQRNYLEAEKRYNEALKISKQLGDRSLNSSCLLNIGNLRRIQGNTQEASRLFNEALIIAEEIGDVEAKSSILEYIKLNNQQTSGTQKALLSKDIGVVTEDIDCHPKWTNNDIKSFIKGFTEGFFNEFRDSLNWQRIKVVYEELDSNTFTISSGSPIKATFQILEKSKKKKMLQIKWEERSDIARSVWIGIVKQFRIVFSNPGLKSIQKLIKK